MKHKTILILISLLIIFLASFFYIDNIFLPIQFKRFITTKAESLLGREVSVGSIDFRALKGFIIKNISVSRKDDPDKPFFQVDEITFNLLLAPIFQKKAIILPSIKVKNPYLYVSRDDRNVWNFSDLLSLGTDLTPKNSFTILLRKLSLEGGKIHYKDTSTGQEFFESFENIRLQTTLSLNKGIRFIIQATVPRKKSSLKVKGNYSLLPNKLTAQVLTDSIHLPQYLSLLYASKPYAHLVDGVLSSGDFGLVYEEKKLRVQGAFLVNKTRLEIGEGNQIDGTVYVPTMLLTWHNNKWNAKGRLQLSSVNMVSADGKKFQGDIKADLNLLTISGNNMTSQGNVTINDAYLVIDDNKHFKGNITATNASLSKGDGKIRLQGNFDIAQTDIMIGEKISLKGAFSTTNTNLIWFRDSLGTSEFTVKTGFTMDNARTTFENDRGVSGNINVHQANLSVDRKQMIIEAFGQLKAANISLGKDKNFTGSPYFNLYIRHAPKDKVPIDYKSSLRFINGAFTGAPYLDTISNLDGIIAIMPDQVQTNKLSFTVYETDIQLSGLLTNFLKPKLNVRASSGRVNIPKILELFPSLKEITQADIAGTAIVDASYNGLISSPSKAGITGSAQISGTTITHEMLPQAVTNISGQLNYGDDHLTWKNLKADFKDKQYSLDGRLDDFSRPTITTKVLTDELDLNTQINLLNSAFQFASLSGSYLNSSFDLKGDVHLFESSPADIDIRGEIGLDLADIGMLIPRINHRVKQFNPTGTLSCNGIFKGTLEDWRNWQLAFDAKSDRIKLDDLPFENVDIRFTQRDQAITKCNGASKVYGGNLTVTSSADLRDDAVTFNTSISVKNLDFARIREEKILKNRQLAGILSLSTDLSGTAAEWRELTGEGSLSITNGHLWQWNILSGMSNALLIPEFKNFVFTDALGDFTIADQRIFTDNARMTSKSVTLDGKGWIDFEKNLNFQITPTFSELAILQSKSIKKGPTSILTQTKGYLNIKLSGTLDKPRFNVEKSPLKILEGALGNTTETITDVIGGVFGEIF